MHGATAHPVAAEHARPPGHGGHRCGADVYAEQRTATLQMAIESPFRCVDTGLRSDLVRVPDVDDDHVGLARFGQSLLYGFIDRHLMTEAGDDVSEAL